MRQHHLAAKARGGGGKRVGDVAEQQAIVRRYAVVEAVDLAIEDVDFAFRQMCAQMVVGAAVTQPHLEHDAGTAAISRKIHSRQMCWASSRNNNLSSRVNLFMLPSRETAAVGI